MNNILKIKYCKRKVLGCIPFSFKVLTLWNNLKALFCFNHFLSGFIKIYPRINKTFFKSEKDGKDKIHFKIDDLSFRDWIFRDSKDLNLTAPEKCTTLPDFSVFMAFAIQIVLDKIYFPSRLLFRRTGFILSLSVLNWTEFWKLSY